MRKLLRGPFGRLGEAIPEARYEVVQALLRTSVCLTGAFTILTVNDGADCCSPRPSSTSLIGLVSLVARCRARRA